MPPVQTVTIINVGGDLNANLGYTCNGFNPAVSIVNTLNNIEGSVEGLQQNVINSVTAAIGSFPMYLLERADPSLYNLIQNMISGASDQFDVSMRSCQQALGDIRQGVSPYQDWFKVSDSQGWLDFANAAQQGQSVDIYNAVKQTTQNGPNYGVPWLHNGQNSGGSIGNQVPIHVIADIVMAGYNIMVDSTRALDDDTPPTVEEAPDLTQFWATPKDAGNFAKLLLGDITISTVQSMTNQNTTAGTGLMPILISCPAVANTERTCVKTIRAQLTQMVAGTGSVDPNQLDAVSAHGMAVTQDVIDGLSNLDSAQQQLYVSRIAEDVAVQNLLDETLMLRQLLMAGSHAQVVQNLQPALNAVNIAIARLEKDVDGLLSQHELRQKKLANTLQSLLSSMGQDQRQAQSTQNQVEPSRVLQGGAVYTNNNN